MGFLDPRPRQKQIYRKMRESRKIKNKLLVEKQRAERVEHKKRKKRAQQELYQLENELRAAKELSVDEPETTGALPDFVIIGVKKGGTTSLYNLLTQHPHVEPAAKKELHYFDVLYEDEDVEWYRRCFPTPRWKDGRMTITGEATPYLGRRSAVKRMAAVIPQARLIVLLRNPVDRAYSDYHQVTRKGLRPRTFEEAIEAEQGAREASEIPPLDKDKAFEPGNRGGLGDTRYRYLSRGIYVDQLLHLSRFFPKEQMLVLKSEDFFERPRETLKLVLGYLDLPSWEPVTLEGSGEDKNEGEYERKMDPAIKQQLEEFFEPHNQRLYDYLGQDFGW